MSSSDAALEHPATPAAADSEPATLGLLVRDLHRLLHQAFEERIRFFGISATSCRYLAVIREWNGATPSELSNYFGVRTPTTLSSLRNLEEKRLIRRSSDANDGRKSIYRLTARGTELESRIRAAFLDVEREALAPLSAESAAQFHHLVGEIRMSLRKLLGDDRDAPGRTG
ncbi:MAG: MarR family transcriptional regulator [Steroidobacteraceae bacterium]